MQAYKIEFKSLAFYLQEQKRLLQRTKPIFIETF